MVVRECRMLKNEFEVKKESVLTKRNLFYQNIEWKEKWKAIVDFPREHTRDIRCREIFRGGVLFRIRYDALFVLCLKKELKNVYA